MSQPACALAFWSCALLLWMTFGGQVSMGIAEGILQAVSAVVCIWAKAAAIVRRIVRR